MWQFEPLNYYSSPDLKRNNVQKNSEFTQHKKIVLIITVSIAVSVIIFISFFVGLIAFLNSESKENNRQLYQYYQDDENYITVTGTLDVFYYYSSDYLFFTLTNNNETVLQLKEEFRVVLTASEGFNSSFYRDVTIGKSLITVTYSSYDLFGDMPVVAIYMDGKCYLDFETGKANLLKYLEDNYL